MTTDKVVTARPYEDRLLETLSSQIASTVQWSGSVQYLLAQSHSRGKTAEFEELGHGDVLTKLVETIRQQTSDDVLDGFFPGQTAEAADVANSDGPAAVPINAAAEKVRSWNASHPVGTKVKSTIMESDDLETRTGAVLLFGHRAAVHRKATTATSIWKKWSRRKPSRAVFAAHRTFFATENDARPGVAFVCAVSRGRELLRFSPTRRCASSLSPPAHRSAPSTSRRR